jgi:hypothetical protein
LGFFEDIGIAAGAAFDTLEIGAGTQVRAVVAAC